jgi:hypothetical protein
VLVENLQVRLIRPPVPFVLGRVRVGVGEGITGFSLSLTLSVASFLSDTSILLQPRCLLLMAGCS